MTGGQMAPTTLMGMKTATCPYGRQADLHGFPLHVTDIAATLEGTCYVTRQAVNSVANIRRAKKALRQAFENSINRRGSSLVEIVSTCASGWKMTPEQANANYEFAPDYASFTDTKIFNNVTLDFVSTLWEELKTESAVETWIHVVSGTIVLAVVSIAAYSIISRRVRSRDYRKRDKMIKKAKLAKK